MAYSPKSNTRFWKNKFAENIARDARVRRQLRKLGWKVHVAWECQIKTKPEATLARILTDLNAG
jgi:DNA mismatch endonuclease (patch repair protein)